MMIALVAFSAAVLGSLLTLAFARIEIRDEFEVEEFKKFSDVFRGRK